MERIRTMPRASRLFGKTTLRAGVLAALLACLGPGLGMALAKKPAASATRSALAIGHAEGTLIADGKPFPLTYAATFVDHHEEGHPVVLVLSDLPLPVEEWSNHDDLVQARARKSWNGVGFWLDDKRHVIRSIYYEQGISPTSGGDLFELTVGKSDAKSLSGSARSTSTANSLTLPVKLDIRFHAALPPPEDAAPPAERKKLSRPGEEPKASPGRAG